MGLRRGEILGLRWKDINLENKQLSVRQVVDETKKHGVQFKSPKTQKSNRTVTMPEITIETLRLYKAKQAEINLQLGKGMNGDSLLFDSPLGLWTPSKLTNAYRGFISKHELKHVTFHDLRHTHATHLLEQNIHPKVVSERLGHSNIAITLDTYSHVLPNMQEDAASVTDQLLKTTS